MVSISHVSELYSCSFLFQSKTAKAVERKQKDAAYGRAELAFLYRATSPLCSMAMSVFGLWSLRCKHQSPPGKGDTAPCCFIWMKRDEKTKLGVMKLDTR